MSKRLFLVLVLASVLPLSADSADPLMSRVEQAQLTAAVGTLRECRQELTERLSGESPSALDRYNLAYVSWRLNQALYAENGTEDKRQKLLSEAADHLETTIEIDSDNAEALALLAGVLGEMIGESAIRGMKLGPKTSSLLKKAVRLAPENPRVALQRGISYFHTPSLFGGSVDKAIGEFQRARELFARQPQEVAWPNWGLVDAHAWLGQALARKGRVDDARAVYREALELEPNAGWIRFELLPALDR